MKYQFILAHRGEFQVTVLCRVLAVSVSGYYAWRQRGSSQQATANAGLSEQVQAVHQHSRQTYGSRRVTAALRAQGTLCNRKRVARLMGQLSLRGCDRRKRRPRTTQPDGTPAAAPNRLKRNFSASAPNQVWVGDITYLDTDQGWLYLAGLVDVFSRKVVGWAMSEHIDAALVEAALQMALAQRHPRPGLIHHTDQGRQYLSTPYQDRLAAHQALVSLSRPGNCYDNALSESFWATLKSECATGPFATRAEARTTVFEYIEVFYNRQRLHSALGYRSPAQFETDHLTVS
jgi:transposase InsO family protein